MSGTDPFLLGLFREEMAAHAETLTQGLLALEERSEIALSNRTEPMMRAAHSIKGAARVVDLGAVSRVAHAMEDLLLAVGEGREAISEQLVDRLLGAIDWMTGLAAQEDPVLAAQSPQVDSAAEDWIERLQALSNGVSQPDHDSRTHADPEPPPSPPLRAQLKPPSPDPAESLPPSPQASEREASVRLSAENLSQMLAYSASLLLEARQLEGLLQSGARWPRQLRRAVASVAVPAGDVVPAPLLESELAAVAEQLEARDRQLIELSLRLNGFSERLHALVLRGRLRPFAEGTQGFPRMIRDLARELGKRVEFTVIGGATLIDRDILSGLDAPLNHLLRNALDHGIEPAAEREQRGKAATGQIRLEARHLSGRLLITLEDDGRGIDAERLRKKIIERGLLSGELAAQLQGQELYAFLFLPGLSTREAVSEISGRGFGLDIVQTVVHGCGGSIKVFSDVGAGTRFELQLPVTRSVVRCLRVEVAGASFALPLSRIDRALRRPLAVVEFMDGMAFFREQADSVALVSARQLFSGGTEIPLPESLSLVLFSQDHRHYALQVDALIGETDLVVRPLDARLGKVTFFSAAAIDAEGRPLLIIDVDDLIQTVDRLASQGQPRSRRQQLEPVLAKKRILVVDDSLTVREVERKHLQNAGFSVDVAVDGVDGWNQLMATRFDLLVTDVDMPRLNGIDLVKRVRADARLSSLPVVIVSYKDRDEDRLRGMQAGADYYLTKSSFHDSSLIKAVTDLIGASEDP